MLTLVQIKAPHFVAGLEARDGHVVRAAPIIGYMCGWDGRKVATYCRRKGWELNVIQPFSSHIP